MDGLLQFWAERSPREKSILLAGAAVIVAALIYLLTIEPAVTGITRLEQLTQVRESELYRLHGMGAKAIGQLRVALAARGQGLAEEVDR